MENTQTFNAQKVLKKQKVFGVISKTLIYAFLIIMAISTLFPFYWMINTSLKSFYDYTNQNPQTFFPTEIHWENYYNAINTSNFGAYLLNTVIVGITSTVLGIFITIFAAFAFARLNFRGKELLFSLLMATMMVPGELFQITNLITIMNLQWQNSYIVLILPFVVSVFYVYLLRNSFRQIPNELYYAAKVDGTTDMKYLWKVMVPLSMPTITSITILKLMGSWNSYIWPRLVNTPGGNGVRPMQMITNWLTLSFTDPETNMVHQPMRMAGVVIVSLPLFVVFIFFRKYIMRGVSRSGTKG
ncbi:MAG TPA: carbohydrate ABC transporter permease [Candidatus Pelethenecus faecipullorum]|mgnify:FL=1|uniref:Carbohydrate ABC transporter permease n=1 Tax=Candidatus Pelethenecus faecipullorum TaxID=2840900 RepID=A0A9D1GRW9_9MOLU|nr:carbohydrate ABC transporter permease [Candidatus Pelethenecus faecipullorum]